MDKIAPVETPADFTSEVDALAQRFRKANGPFMRLVNRLGGTLESQLALVPDSAREPLERATARALQAAYAVAGRGPDLGDRTPMVAAIATGSAGGFGGLATALAELPVTVTLILNTIRAAATDAGYDPDQDWVRAECLKVFGAGSPLSSDDGVNTSFLTARLTITGSSVQSIIASVAPKLAGALGQKLAAQAVPVVGAVTGAALNAAFLTYYREVARIRFRLMRLSETHGIEPVLAAFQKAVEPPKIVKM